MKNNNLRLFPSIIGLALSSQSAVAEVTPVIHVGYEYGGDKLFAAKHSDGTRDGIRLGEGSLLSFGGRYILNEYLSARATLGWKYQGTTDASNGDANLLAYPIDALAFATINGHVLGAGITYHMTPTVYGSGFLELMETYFDNAVGNVLEYNYAPSKKFFWGVRYTSLASLAYREVHGFFELDASSYSRYVRFFE